MTERFRMFRITQVELGRRIERTKEKLTGNSSQMGNLDRDGDTMDDTLLLGAKTERMLLERELRELETLNNSSELISKPISKEFVSVGHVVYLAIRYPGEEELGDTTVVIGSRLDKRFLNNNLCVLAEGVELISEESELSKAILGKKVNDEVTYHAHDSTGFIKILGIDDSSLTRK